jgi:hypothetical protein
MNAALLTCLVPVALTSLAGGAAAQKSFPPDRLYVVNVSGTLLELDEAGAFVEQLDAQVSAMAFGPDGLLYVANGDGIRALDADGDVIKPSFGGALEGVATGMCFGADGQLFVSDLGAERFLRVYDVQAEALLRSLDISAPLNSPLSLAPDGHAVATFAARITGGDTVLQLVEFDTAGGQLTTIDLGDIIAIDAGATTFGPDGNQYLVTTVESLVTVRSPAGLPVATIGTGAGIEGPTDLRFGPDGNLYVASFDSDAIVVIDTTGNLVRTLDAAGIDGPLSLAFSPRRFHAKLAGKLVDADGVSTSLKAEAIATLAPGQLMLAIQDASGAQDFASLFGATLVFSGHHAAGTDSKTRRLLAAAVLDATLDAGFAAADLSIKGKLDKEDGRFLPTKAKGTLLRAAAGLVWTGKLTTGTPID